MSIEVKSLSYAYGKREILNDISLNAGEGELISIIGKNGVGKSTLIKCILRLLTNYKGEVLVNGHNTKRMSVMALASLVAYIPQESSPVFNFTVEDIVLMGTCPTMGYLRSPAKYQKELAMSALSKLGIEDMKNRYFHQLSGGEKQLVIIAKALAQGTKILIMDEPTSNLDFGNQIRILERARALCNEGYTIVQCTHNPEHSYMFSDKVIALKEGRILSVGKPHEVLSCDVVSDIYGLELCESKLYDDKVRTWIPKSAV